MTMAGIDSRAPSSMEPRIDRLECWVLRAPITEPLANAFGAMRDRPALFLRITDNTGACGWGEVFCNFPQVGAEHRARLVSSIFVPLLENFSSSEPAIVRSMLEQRTRQMAIQCGEPGPFSQITGAIDQALWDLAARRQGLPVWRLLGGQNRVRVYASGIGPDQVVELALRKRDEGFRAFKLKVGFGAERDLANLSALRKVLGEHACIMCDANQAWQAEQAAEHIAALAPLRPFWMEEPIGADRPHSEWLSLARQSPIPLAAGENLRGEAQFSEAISADYLRFIQPDVGKWGGISAGQAVARHAVARRQAYCPHWLGGGVGLAASLHSLAGSGSDQGWAEVDANPNPLREEVFPLAVEDGWVTLSDAPGLGVQPDLDQLAPYRVSVDGVA